MSIPQSTIYVCSNVRLNSRYEHTIYFADRTKQLSYFAGKVVKTFSAYSFIRKSWDLNVAATMEEAASWSYLYFTNTANGKRYFYFIDNIEYVNDGTVRLKLQIDVLQTYLFDDGCKLLPCFVERQHTATDAIGDNTIDEGLELGELVDNDVFHWETLNDLCILVLATVDPANSLYDPDNPAHPKPVAALAGNYNGVFSGLKVWAVDSSDWVLWGKRLENLSEGGYDTGIISMWMYPKSLVKLGGENTWDDDSLCKVVDGAKDAGGTYRPFSGRPESLNGYTPKNKKLLCYPYSLLYVTNNSGGSANYRWERFEPDATPKFSVAGSLSSDGGVKLYPLGYNGLKKVDSNGNITYIENYEHGLTLGGFPTCAWNSDVYKMWLAQQQNQFAVENQSAAISMGAGAISVAASLMTGNVIGAGAGALGIIGGAQKISSIIAQKQDMSVQPPQAKGRFSSNVNITAGKQTFSFYKKTVSREIAKVIDDYFTMYGYKINRVQTPNIHTRKSHTYIKTVGCHIEADLCNEDATKIESIFDNGVTFWTDGDRIGQYNDNNNPL